MNLLVKNAAIPGNIRPVDILVENGRISAVGTGPEDYSAEVVDAGGRLVTPPFVDPHLHLDAVLTAGKPRYNAGGTHPEGIEVWGEYKQAYPGFEDMKERVRRAVEWEVSLGVQKIRTHIDVCDPELTALKTMLEMKEQLNGIADIQIVAFPQDGIVSYPQGRELMNEAMILGADIVGGIPHCEWTREDGVESIRFVYDLAEKYDRDIDIHCDETDDPQSRYLEVLAAEALHRGFQGRVTAGHTTAMHSYDNSYAFKLISLVKRAGVNIIANPFDNVVLMGRFDNYPVRRGITRVKELLEEGVNVSLGHDSIMDPWYPLGRGDMLEAALLGVHLCHMTGHNEITRMFDTVTVNPARAMGFGNSYGLKAGAPADFVILDCNTVNDAIRLSPARLSVYRAGRPVARTRPEKAEILYGERPENIDFLSR